MKDGRPVSASSPWGRRERRRVDQVALAAPAILPALCGYVMAPTLWWVGLVTIESSLAGLRYCS